MQQPPVIWSVRKCVISITFDGHSETRIVREIVGRTEREREREKWGWGLNKMMLSCHAIQIDELTRCIIVVQTFKRENKRNTHTHTHTLSPYPFLTYTLTHALALAHTKIQN